MRYIYDGQDTDAQESSVETIPYADPLRGDYLQPPYYGIPPLGHFTTDAAFDKDSRYELTSQIRDREQELRGMYALLNAGATVNRLPTELLVEIFKCVRSESHRDRSPMEWLDVLRVCRHWFVVGSTAATLWQDLEVETRTSLLRTGLSRSREGALTVRTSRFRTVPLAEMTGLLVPHLHRLSKLNIDRIPTQFLPAFVAFMDNDMPALHCLEASVDRPHEDILPETVIKLSPTSFPRLQELDIRGFQVFANGGIASQLHDLHLAYCYLGKDTQLGAVALVDVICEMRNIRKLSLGNMRVREWDGAPRGRTPDRVVLDQLQHAMIHASGLVVKEILSAFVFPPTASVFFDCSQAGMANIPHGQTPLNRIIPADRTCLPILSQVISLRATASEKQHALEGFTAIWDPEIPATYYRPRLDVHVAIPGEGLGQLQGPVSVNVVDLVNMFSDAPLLNLDVHVLSEAAKATNWQGLFATFPKLQSFSLNLISPPRTVPEDLPNADIVFSALDPEYAATTATAFPPLGDQEFVPSGSNNVLCPDLKRISVRGIAAADPGALFNTMTACLENRRRVLGGQGGGIETISLELEGFDDDEGPEPEAFLEVKAAIEDGLSSLVGDVTVVRAPSYRRPLADHAW